MTIDHDETEEAHHILYHFQSSVQMITKGGGIYTLRKLIATTSLPQRKGFLLIG